MIDTPKIYNREQNVYQKSKERLEYIFNLYDDEHIYINFSGGKDSSIVLYLALEIAKEQGRKFNVLFIDQELEHPMTVDYINRIRQQYKDYFIKFWWVCPHMYRKITFLGDRVMEVWGKDKMRDFPNDCYVHDMTNRTPKKNGLIKKIMKSFLTKQKIQNSAFVLGLRANESVRRYSACTLNDSGIEGIYWSTRAEGNNNIKFYPIYDWYDKDIWKYIGDNDLDYNRIYDIYYMKELPISEMRSSSIINVHALKKLTVIKEVDIEYWNRLHKRIGDVDALEDKEICELKVKEAKASKKRKLGKEKTLELWERLKKEL